MKERFWKKTLSVCLALLMVAALIPAQLIISAGATSGVSYTSRSWNGSQVVTETKTADCVDYNSNITDLDGWYYVNGYYEVSQRLNVTGTANIVILDGSTLSAKDGIHVPEGKTLNVYNTPGGENGTLECVADTDDAAAIGGNEGENCGTVNIYSGTVIANTHDNGEDAAGIGGGFKGYGGHINIYGGKIKATGGSVNYDGGAGIGGGGGDDGVGGFGGFIKIYGGDVTALGGAAAAGIGGGDEGTSGDIEIFGGTVHAGGGPTSSGGAGIGGGNEKGVNNIVIYNGSVTAYGGAKAAGIGGGDEGNGGNITIAGGTVEATGGHYGAGIGSGQEGSGFEIKITNAQVKATGGDDAAGIGGGDGATGGTITITDSLVSATGGSEYSDGGAGIGGGNEGNGGTITITNSEVQAQGGCDAAGIGGGDYGVGGDITITGSVVKGIGGDYGAGIGGGQCKDGGNIKINGTRVAGVGGEYAAGIGGGGNSTVSVGGNGGVITITGGEVAAEGGEYGAGIGGGYEAESGKITITGGTIEASGGNGGAGVGSGAACAAYEDAVDITIEGGDIKASGGSSTTDYVYAKIYSAGASIGAGGCTYELLYFALPGDIDDVSYFAGTINLNGGTITANRTIGATEEDSLEWVEKGEVYFNGATVQIETDEEYPSVRATTIIFKDEEGIRQKVSYADSGSGPYTVVPKDDRIPTLKAVDKKYVKVSLCEHENMIYTDNGDNHTESCPHCKYIATQAHEYGNPIWSWAENHSAATATFTCEECGHKETVNATVTSEASHDKITYTATVQLDSTVYTDVQTVYTDGVGVELYGYTLSLDGDIGINFYMELSDAVAKSSTAKMHFTIPKNGDPDTKDIKVSDARKVEYGDKTYYVFKCQVAAKEMTSDITAQIIDGDKHGELYTYSVKKYADYLIAHAEENAEWAKAVPLVKAMLNYGAYSQIHFDKNSDKLANAGLTEAEKALGNVSINVDDYDVSGLPAGVTFAGASLSLKSETTLSLYFKSDDDLEFSCGDYFVQDVPNGEYQVARIRGIKAARIGDMLTLKVNGNAVTYSPLNYIKKALNGGTDDVNLQNAVKALYLYWDAAQAYFSE